MWNLGRKLSTEIQLTSEFNNENSESNCLFNLKKWKSVYFTEILYKIIFYNYNNFFFQLTVFKKIPDGPSTQYEINIPELPHNRRTTDRKFLIVFFVFVIILVSQELFVYAKLIWLLLILQMLHLKLELTLKFSQLINK